MLRRAPPAPSAEILALTGLRAVLAWFVVAFHFLRDPLDIGFVYGRRLLSAGHLSVDLFFVLSGYVLAKSYTPASVGTAAGRALFWRRRFARIYPVYLVSLALGFAGNSKDFLGDLHSIRGGIRLVLDIGSLNAWSHVAMFKYNWAAWSLSVEALFYALFPLLLPWLTRLPSKRAWLVFLGAWAATFVAPALYTALDPDHLHRAFEGGDEVFWSWYLKFFPVQRIPGFAAGILAARITRIPLGLGTLSSLVLLGIVASGLVPAAFLYSGVTLPLLVVIVVAVGQTRGGPLASRPLVAFGHASYSTYILHVPFFLFLARFVDPALWDHTAHVLAYMAALAVLSLVSFRAVEEPARRWLLGGRTTRRPT